MFPVSNPSQIVPPPSPLTSTLTSIDLKKVEPYGCEITWQLPERLGKMWPGKGGGSNQRLRPQCGLIPEAAILTQIANSLQCVLLICLFQPSRQLKQWAWIAPRKFQALASAFLAGTFLSLERSRPIGEMQPYGQASREQPQVAPRPTHMVCVTGL